MAKKKDNLEELIKEITKAGISYAEYQKRETLELIRMQEIFARSGKGGK